MGEIYGLKFHFSSVHTPNTPHFFYNPSMRLRQKGDFWVLNFYKAKASVSFPSNYFFSKISPSA
jgi:hypothetical protein